MLAWFAVVILWLMTAGAHAAERPNILLLVAEDLSPRIGAWGDTVADTPNLDALARRGVRFTNVFTTAGVCAPSRAALITGMYQNGIGAGHMRSSNRPSGGYAAVPPAEVKAFPELLRASGYFTFTDSKLDYQFSGPLAGSGPFTIWDAEGRGADWRSREQGQPFFGMINFAVTHESGTFAPLGHWPHSFTHFAMQLLRAWQFGDAPQAAMPPTQKLVLPPYYPDIPTVRRELAYHYGNIHVMDRQVGEILAALAEQGLADDTIVIWTSDHGDGLPRAKRELYDSGLQVPMIVYWPERWRPVHITPGTADPRLLSFVDLAPTILALAHAPAPGYLQGGNFLAVNTPPRNYIHAARDRHDEVMDRQRAVRDERFKYIRSWYPQVAGGHPLAFRDNQTMVRDMRALWQAGKLNADQARWFEPVGVERLYDLVEDPFELHDVSGDPLRNADLERLRGELDRWLREVGDMEVGDEDAMVASLLCDGAQCGTPPPRIHLEQGQLRIEATDGASIGYRLERGPWKLYSGPVDIAGARKVEAKAVRYGWRESDEVSATVPPP